MRNIFFLVHLIRIPRQTQPRRYLAIYGLFLDIDEGLIVTYLPMLTRVSSSPTKTLDRILLAHILSEMKYRGSVCRSQRDYGEIFNRIDSARFSRSRRLLERDGWVHRSTLSVGNTSDCYEKGVRLSDHPHLCRGWMSLAHNLWGRDGLLTRWSGSPGWGSGCLGVSGMLVLATVERSEMPLSRMDLSKYLEVFCSCKSVRSSVNKLIDIGVLVDSNFGLLLTCHWQVHLEDFLDTAFAGVERLDTGNKRRQRERLARRQTVERGLLTDAERIQLRNLGCWFSGCRNKGREPDHFPPRKFLSTFEDTLSPHILFSACRKHNARFSHFIASLPHIEPERCEYWIAENVDPMLLFRTSNNLQFVKFIQHANHKNKAGALSAIKRSSDFFFTLQEDGFTSKSRLAPSVNQNRPRRRKGSAVVTKKSTFRSQI